MKIGVIQFISLCAVVQAVLFVIFLISCKKNTTLNKKLMAALLSTYSVMILCALVLSQAGFQRFYGVAHIVNQSAFLIGPLFYFYISSIVIKSFQLKRMNILHTVPFLSAVIYLIIKFYFITIPITCRFNELIIGSVLFIQNFIYIMMTMKSLDQNGYPIKRIWASQNDEKAIWLRFFTLGCVTLWLLKLAFFIVWDAAGLYELCPYPLRLYLSTSFFFICLITYFGLRMPHLFNGVKKYENSILNSLDRDACHSKITTLMEEEKLYRDPNLTLPQLAQRLSIPPRYLSQILNESFGRSFYEFINDYRIRECKEIFKSVEQPRRTILEIIYSVGFNSKSTFNSSFKRTTGVTPSEYRKLVSPPDSH